MASGEDAVETGRPLERVGQQFPPHRTAGAGRVRGADGNEGVRIWNLGLWPWLAVEGREGAETTRLDAVPGDPSAWKGRRPLSI